MTDAYVFAGDSITDAGRREDPEGLGDGWVRLVAAELPGARIVNAGVSGDRVVDLARRWEADVLSAAPDVLTVYLGINDVWRRYDSDDPTSPEDFAAGYAALLDTVAPRTLVLVEPFLVPATEEQRTWGEDLDPKRAAVARLAAERGAVLVPLHEAMNAAAATDGVGAIAPDGVHPTPRGDRLIADAWLAAVPLP